MMKFYGKFLLLILFALNLAVSNAEAKELIERWSEKVTGEALVDDDMTRAEARILCLNRAKARAIEEVAGVKVVSETLVKDAQLLSDLVAAQSYAWVKSVKNEIWEEENIARDQNGLTRHLYRVHLKALVAVDPNRDEGFTLKLDLNRFSFQNDDEMELTVKTGQDAYLTIINILEDEKVAVLLPNRFKMNRFAGKGQKLRFPDPETMGKRKIKIKSEKGKVAKEAIVAIATIDDIDLVDGSFSEATINSRPSDTSIASAFLEKLLEIPPSRRAMAIKHYEVNGK